MLAPASTIKLVLKTMANLEGPCIRGLGVILVLVTITLISSLGFTLLTLTLPMLFGSYSQDFTLSKLFLFLHALFTLYILTLISTNYYWCVVTKPGYTDALMDEYSRLKGTGTEPVSEGDAQMMPLMTIQSTSYDVDEAPRREGNGSLQAQHQHDPLGVLAMKTCRHCNQPKPERAHHCKVCKRCVMKMDHHCPWIYNCVGHFNHRYFTLFTIYAAIGTGYFAVMSFPLFYDLFFHDATQKQYKFPRGTRFDIFILLYILSAALSVMIGILGGLNLYYVCTAQTQIEVLDNRWMRDMARANGG
ncbi:hypothetical protein HDU98_000215, partial [Podochytrium sp. JEL0797]